MLYHVSDSSPVKQINFMPNFVEQLKADPALKYARLRNGRVLPIYLIGGTVPIIGNAMPNSESSNWPPTGRSWVSDGSQDIIELLHERPATKPQQAMSHIEAQVYADIEALQQKGGTKCSPPVAVHPLELKAWFQHAYEECLEQAAYLKRAIQELERKTEL
jgi:hypothetical protein